MIFLLFGSKENPHFPDLCFADKYVFHFGSFVNTSITTAFSGKLQICFYVGICALFAWLLFSSFFLTGREMWVYNDQYKIFSVLFSWTPQLTQMFYDAFKLNLFIAHSATVTIFHGHSYIKQLQKFRVVYFVLIWSCADCMSVKCLE